MHFFIHKKYSKYSSAISLSENDSYSPDTTPSVAEIWGDQYFLVVEYIHTYSSSSDFRYTFSTVWYMLRETEYPVRKNWGLFCLDGVWVGVCHEESGESPLSHFRVLLALDEKISYHPYSDRSISSWVYVLQNDPAHGGRNCRAVDWPNLTEEVIFLAV